MIRPKFEPDFASWRVLARDYLQKGVSPAEIDWSGRTQLDLFGSDESSGQGPKASAGFRVNPDFIALAETVSYARDDSRWDLLYRILYRLTFENPHLLKVAIDVDMSLALALAHSVRRDIHKMHAFVRFKKIEQDGRDHYVAWHKPEHLIVRPGTPFFARRFGDRTWSIFTSDLSAHFDGKEITFTEGIEQSDFVHTDTMDDIWKTYYRSTFNPARIKLKMMKSEMATKYWSTLPEVDVIKDLLREAPERLSKMALMQTEVANVPADADLPSLKKLASACHACPLADPATQTVFGEGPASASIMVVGEQPGDTEDLTGRPFQGPAGDIFNEALKHAGLSRADLYVTNAVKHFKFEQKGKARIHKKASGSEMHACKPWLEAEIDRVKPKLIILLGATAGTAVLGRLPKISSERGQVVQTRVGGPHLVLSWHPAAILRAGSDDERQKRFDDLCHDLITAKNSLAAAEGEATKDH
jgi:probable DNA metabolism protein